LREADGERGAHLLDATDLNAGAIRFNVALDQNKAEARALMAAYRLLTLLREWLTQRRQIGLVDALADVADFKRKDGAAMAKEPYRKPSPLQ
jgi:hypothetical protein